MIVCQVLWRVRLLRSRVRLLQANRSFGQPRTRIKDNCPLRCDMKQEQTVFDRRWESRSNGLNLARLTGTRCRRHCSRSRVDFGSFELAVCCLVFSPGGCGTPGRPAHVHTPHRRCKAYGRTCRAHEHECREIEAIHAQTLEEGDLTSALSSCPR